MPDTMITASPSTSTKVAIPARATDSRITWATILRVGEHYAHEGRPTETTAHDTGRAVDERDRRASRLRDRVHESVTRRIVMVDTEGEKTGQVNGRSVHAMGDDRIVGPRGSPRA
jgi:predicted ATP-dependent protease